MSYEELKQYVASKRDEGQNDEEIIRDLNEKSWDPELIEKAMNKEEIVQVAEVEESKIPDTIELFKYTWKSFAKNFQKYIISSIVSSFLPLIAILILSIPVFYDVLVLKLTASDLMSSTLAPVFIPYVFVLVIVAIILSMLGSLMQIIIINHNAEIKIFAALKKAWAALPGFLWINIITFAAVIVTLIPAVILMVVAEMNLIPQTYSYFITGFTILLFLPCILLAIMFSFAPFSYIEHGARGKVAILSSYHITKNKLSWVLVKLLALWLCLVIVNIISQNIPALGFFLGLISSPLSLIFLYKLYLSAEYQYKESQKEVEAVTE